MRYRKVKAFIFTLMLLLTTFSHLTFAASASYQERSIPQNMTFNKNITTGDNNAYDDPMAYSVGSYDEAGNLYTLSLENSFKGWQNSPAFVNGVHLNKFDAFGNKEYIKSIRINIDGSFEVPDLYLDGIEVISEDNLIVIITLSFNTSIDIFLGSPWNMYPDMSGTASDRGTYTMAFTVGPGSWNFNQVTSVKHNDNISEETALIDSAVDSEHYPILTTRGHWGSHLNLGLEYEVDEYNENTTFTVSSPSKGWYNLFYTSPGINNPFTVRSDIVGNNSHYLVQAKSHMNITTVNAWRNATTPLNSFNYAWNTTNISCPANSELDSCYVWIEINNDIGNITNIVTFNNPRATFSSFSVRGSDAYMGGFSGYADSTLCPQSCNSTNFTGTPSLKPENIGENRTLVFASLNQSTGAWNYAHHTELDVAVNIDNDDEEKFRHTRFTTPNQQNHYYHSNGSLTYMYSCIPTNFFGDGCSNGFEIDGMNISLGNTTDSQIAYFMIDSSGTYQWHKTIGFNTTHLQNDLNPISSYSSVFSNKIGIAAMFIKYGGYDAGLIISNNDSLIQNLNVSMHTGVLWWINTVNGNITDIEFAEERNYHPIAISSNGDTITSDYIHWFADSSKGSYIDGYHCLESVYLCDIPGGSGTSIIFDLYSADNDIDGLINAIDNCPDVANHNQSDYDGDNEGDACDLDDDNDGINDLDDLCHYSFAYNTIPFVSSINLTRPDLTTDWDADGCEDSTPADLDDDNDGIVDQYDVCPKGIVGLGGDHDQEGCKDAEDSDDDNDSILDVDDSCQKGDIGWEVGIVTDYDGDGCQDDLEDDDDDNDGVVDDDDLCPKGLMDWKSNSNTDFNGDGCLDSVEDEDNDDDGIQNFADLCQYSQGEVDENGCTMAQLLLMDSSDDSDNNSLPSMMFVCPGGLAVVLDLADCPPVEEDNETMPVIMYVCSGGTAVVSNLTDCPQSNDNSTTNQTEDQNTTQVPSFYYVCYGGGMVVQNLTDCPEDTIKDEEDSNTNEVSSGSDSDDNTLLIMVGGAFILSIISMLVGLLRSSNGSKEDISGLTQEFEKSHDFDFELSDNNDSMMPIEEPSAEENPTEESETEDKPPIFVNGTPNEGYEWIKWPEGSGQDWYREIDSNGEWMKWN